MTICHTDEYICLPDCRCCMNGYQTTRVPSGQFLPVQLPRGQLPGTITNNDNSPIYNLSHQEFWICLRSELSGEGIFRLGLSRLGVAVTVWIVNTEKLALRRFPWVHFSECSNLIWGNLVLMSVVPNCVQNHHWVHQNHGNARHRRVSDFNSLM